MAEFSDHSDEQLMDAVADDDLGPLNELLRRYQQRLLHFLSRLCGNETAAAELFERTFVSLYKARRLYDPSIRFSTLIFGTAYSQYRARMATYPNELTYSWTMPTPSPAARGLETLGLDQRDGQIRRAMGRLPPEQRAALHLCLLDNLGFFQAAQCLQVGEAECRVLVNQAFQHLKNDLGQDFLRGRQA